VFTELESRIELMCLFVAADMQALISSTAFSGCTTKRKLDFSSCNLNYRGIGRDYSVLIFE
jgi:hypothetical protein